MGKYDKQAEQTANKTDIELKEAIDGIINIDVKKLFPNPTDQALVSELIKTVQKSTSRNEVVTAYQVMAVKMTVEGLKVLKGIAKTLAI